MLAFFATGPTLAQPSDPSASLTEKVDAVFAEWDSTRSPGCALAVMKEGEIVYKRAYGMANLDHDVPLAVDSVFHVASVSKQFTAAAVLLLAQEGKLSLDDPVQKHLARVPDLGHEITLRHLLHHSSGMRDQWSLLGLAGWRYSRDLITDEDVMSLISRQKRLNFPPGERYLYCNTGYTLLGQVVKEVSGQSLREFTKARIFEPLGMHRTHFRDDFTEIVKSQATGYRRDRAHATFRVSVTNFETVGATSLLTTVEDLARWDRNFYRPLVGGEHFLEQMHLRGVLNSGRDQTYASGLVHGTYKGLGTVSHGGADAGYRAHFLRFPEQRFSLACLCNLAQTNPASLARQVADIYLEKELQTKEPEPAAKKATPEVRLGQGELSRLSGTYWSDDRGAAVQIRGQDGKLMFQLSRSRVYAMIPVGGGRFEVSELDLSARFEPRGGNPVRRLIVWSEDEEEESLQRLDPFEVSPEKLKEFEGAYSSPEIEPIFRIEAGEKNLILHRLKSEPDELRPIAKDVFLGRIGHLRFERDADGTITGFLLDAGRIRNFGFQKRKE
ncbi:MAG: serine hydrolase domain-containing protein [Acidobacteriota bacterium]